MFGEKNANIMNLTEYRYITNEGNFRLVNARNISLPPSKYIGQTFDTDTEKKKYYILRTRK